MNDCFRCSRTYQRLALRCILALILVFAVLAFSNWPPAVNAEHNDKPQLSRKDEVLVDSVATGPKTHQERLVTAEADTAPATSPALQPQKDFEQAWNEASRKVDKLSNDELRIKALLAPITMTGEVLLRDLSHRVRAFKDIYETYESLHFVQGKGE